MVTAPADRARLGRRARLLAAVSVTYNLVEAVVAISAGLVARSPAGSSSCGSSAMPCPSRASAWRSG